MAGDGDPPHESDTAASASKAMHASLRRFGMAKAGSNRSSHAAKGCGAVASSKATVVAAVGPSTIADGERVQVASGGAPAQEKVIGAR